MTRADAIETLARCARESNEALAVIRATHPLRPMSIAESEAKRVGSGEARSEQGDLHSNTSGIEPVTDPATVLPTAVSTVGGGALEAPLGGDRVPPAAPPSPTAVRKCGTRAGWGWHRCALPQGHDGDCCCSCGIPFNGDGAF